MPVFCCSISICWSSSAAIRSKSAIIISICVTWRRFSSTWNFLRRMRLSLRDFMTCTPYTLKSPGPSCLGPGLLQDRLEQLVAVGDAGPLLPLLAQKGLERRVERDGTVHLRIRSLPVGTEPDQFLHV